MILAIFYIIFELSIFLFSFHIILLNSHSFRTEYSISKIQIHLKNYDYLTVQFIAIKIVEIIKILQFTNLHLKLTYRK